MKKISTRQLIIFYCIYSFAIKFLALPAILSGESVRNAWVIALIGTVFELLVIFAVLNVLVIGAGSDIYSDLRSNTKFVGAKLVVLLMLGLLLLQLFILASQSYIILGQNLFTELNIHKFLIPLVIFGAAFCFLPARAFFRSGEIFYLLIIIGIALSVFPALRSMNPGEITPLFSGGFMPILRGFYHNLIYFESAAFLLIFSGDIQQGCPAKAQGENQPIPFKNPKEFITKFMLVAGLVGAFFVFFVFMFTSIFGPLGPTKDLAITNLTTYSEFLTQSGRLDWILVCIWSMLLLLRFGATFFAVFACLRYIFNVKHRAGYIGFSVALFLYLMWWLLVKTPDRLNDFIVIVAPAIAILFFTVPVVCLINALILKKRNSGKKDKKQKSDSATKEARI
ncbi:MAG: GerAB/ArcD/ProY family transporter [Firmicutes bacterium]|nr:GerAB/ArcD/ProY family transporter [Bacillota bacterium]